MKAVICTRYGPPEVLQLQEVPPPALQAREVLIKICATAVTASDCIVRSGKVDPRLWLPMRLMLGFTGPRNPIIGMVLSGEVESLGRDVRRFEKGDPVYAFTMMRLGTYAEFICLPENSVIAPKPANLTHAEAAAIPYGGLLALHYLKKGSIQSGQSVLIYGASGANGTAAVQLAKYFGAKVTGVCSTKNLELVKSLGAEAVIDYTREDFTNQNERYDFILDAVGRKKSAKIPFRKALASDGKFISIDDGHPTPQHADLIFLTELVEAGKLKPVIDRVYPLAQIVEAHRYVDTGHKKGNVVITIRP
jgi:NADPH:quinone reductase-like Zn-dependent oxidoreductase